MTKNSRKWKKWKAFTEGKRGNEIIKNRSWEVVVVDSMGFDDFGVGQYVKISGRFREGEGFLAVEITIEPSPEEAEIECLLQRVDFQRKRLHIFDQEIALQNEIEVRDLEHNCIGLNALQPGQIVKLKGTYNESTGFVPKKMRIKHPMDFNIEQIQGVINKTDQQKKTLQVNGITILVTAKTNIEGLENFT